jgi:nitrite reductase/ring-hydroxylating ferredoxin subunit
MSQSDPDRVRVAGVDELEPGDRKLVTIDGVSIGLFNLDGEYYALRNECPHQGGPVCSGDVHGAIEARFDGVGERLDAQITDDPAITCPWHGWEYSLETGNHLGTESISLPTYDVTVENDSLYIEL